MLLQHYGLALQQALSPEDGFIFRSAGCSGRTGPESCSTRCNSCRASSNNATHYASRAHSPFFAEETWFRIRALILTHVCVIEICCIQKHVSVNPRSMNTDTVERTFGDKRQMVGGSHNKLTALDFDRGDKNLMHLMQLSADWLEK